MPRRCCQIIDPVAVTYGFADAEQAINQINRVEISMVGGGSAAVATPKEV